MKFSDRQYLSKTLVIWFAVLVMASLVVGLQDAAAPVSVSVFPQVPSEGVPVVVTFNLNNPSLLAASADYELYANGKLMMEGATELSPLSNKKYQPKFDSIHSLLKRKCSHWIKSLIFLSGKPI